MAVMRSRWNLSECGSGRWRLLTACRDVTGGRVVSLGRSAPHIAWNVCRYLYRHHKAWLGLVALLITLLVLARTNTPRRRYFYHERVASQEDVRQLTGDLYPADGEDHLWGCDRDYFLWNRLLPVLDSLAVAPTPGAEAAYAAIPFDSDTFLGMVRGLRELHRNGSLYGMNATAVCGAIRRVERHGPKAVAYLVAAYRAGALNFNGINSTSQGNRCPVLYQPRRCTIRLIVDNLEGDDDVTSAQSDLDTADSDVRSGTLSINNRTVFAWQGYQLSDQALAVVIDHRCRARKLREFSDPEVGASGNEQESLEAFHRSLHNGTLVLGIIYGNGHKQLLREIGIPEKRLTRVNDITGMVTFIAYKGFPGFTHYGVVGKGLAYATLDTTFTFGSRFHYRLDNVTYDDVTSEQRDVAPGGSWRPRTCVPRWRVALVIPFRNRTHHLTVFLRNMHVFLQRQFIEYTIYVVEQAEPEVFNRASLMNVGYLEAMRRDGPFDCLAFHDVDQVPEDLTNLYRCDAQPRHLLVTRSVTEYRLRRHKYFGGAIMMTPEQIETINGFPNRFFGWGGEDDDIFARVDLAGMKILRYHKHIGRYISLPHDIDEGNPHIERASEHIYENTAHHSGKDGLNTVNYTVLWVRRRALHTHIHVRIPGPTSKDQVQPKPS